eukprot:52484_1
MQEFNNFIKTRSYVEGYTFSDNDKEKFSSITQAPSAEHPHALRWWKHIHALLGSPVPTGSISAAEGKETTSAVKKVAAKDDDDDVDDLFDDEEEEDKPKVSRAEQMKAAAEAKKANKKIERSQVVIEVKPWEADQDLKALYNEKIRKIKIDGARWGEACNLVPVAYGINKLVISVVIDDDKVGLDDLTDALEALEDDVQSVDITTMNRL